VIIYLSPLLPFSLPGSRLLASLRCFLWPGLLVEYPFLYFLLHGWLHALVSWCNLWKRGDGNSFRCWWAEHLPATSWPLPCTVACINRCSTESTRITYSLNEGWWIRNGRSGGWGLQGPCFFSTLLAVAVTNYVLIQRAARSIASSTFVSAFFLEDYYPLVKPRRSRFIISAPMKNGQRTWPPTASDADS
jgi:hypothetical protein